MRFVRAFYWTIAAAMALCFMVAVLLTFGMTVSRYLLSFSDPTAEYLSRYFVILGTFLGFPVAVLQALHVRFDLIDYSLQGRIKAIFQLIGSLLSMLICVIFAYAAYLFVDDSMLFGEIMPTGFNMPLWIPHASILLGMGLGVVAYALVIVFGPIEVEDAAEIEAVIHHP
ncbi:TRAP transporter small permease [Acuticoccus sp. M5D2P5]|uniref:TRAP transporter small permease n=1 Tax=Acuticoccus kalidii TaxID=2910977 RepID=UPI001F1DE437|nr:TRAP transporter small permease [Acuticoccus kalidii]MCF3934496.1 TRAP transporter small permease [Acuticoccus kalidii]